MPTNRCWRVVAGPFTRADRLRAFIASVDGIEGVTGLVAESFQLGEIALRLRYSGGRPLTDCLAALAEFAPRIEMAANDTIRLDLDSTRPP